MAKIINGKKKASTLKEWLIWQIRRLSYRWPARAQAFADARRSEKEFKQRPGVDPYKVSRRIKLFFECAICGRRFPRREVSADHIDPVVDPARGWEGWDIYLERLFCDKEGFQIICSEDHDRKTEKERNVRTKSRRERKG